ncbi:MAG: [citrate (pro-3S)-lyase] ligase [Desulfuromonadales bacterium]
MVTQLLSRRDIERARGLIEGSGLTFEQNFDTLLGIFANGELAAAGARQGRLLKMLAVAPAHQGGPLLGELVGELLCSAYAAGQAPCFIVTRPQTAASFQALNFVPLVRHPKAVLLEEGHGLERYLESRRALVRDGENGAVVVNCNPFTLGHRYLIEQAAARSDTLYVFVVREERSLFPYGVRRRLVEAGVRDLDNVVILDGGDYAVSTVTFPAYFLKDAATAEQVQMEVDLQLFARRIAPFFNIRRRFVGSEPYCRTTRRYGEAMQRLLPPLGIAVSRIERCAVAGEAISASRVRTAMRHEAFETMRQLVPPTTLDFILSGQGRALGEELRHHQLRRH